MCISNRGNDGIITFREWHPVGVIEYGYVAPDPLDADVIYGAGRNVVTKTHLSTGQVQNISPIPVPSPDVRTDRTEPILFSPQDPHRIYYAANRLYASSDGGGSWQTISDDLTRPASGSPPSVGEMHADKAELQRGVIYSVAASPVAKGLLWAGTDDGLIWVTHNEGGAWSNVTPPELAPWSKVTQIEASHFDANVAYASVSRFRLDDLKPYVYRTRDGGEELAVDHERTASGCTRQCRARGSRATRTAVRGHRKGGMDVLRRRRSLAVAAAQLAAHLDARPGRFTIRT